MQRWRLDDTAQAWLGQGLEPVSLTLGILRADAQGSGKSFSCEGPGAVAASGSPFFA